MQSALVVIDYQNAVFAAPPAYQCELVLGRIAGLIERARANAVPVIYVQHQVDGCEWQAGSPGWEFPAAIAPRPGEHVSPKNACDAFINGALERHLRQQGIEQVYVCGFATEFCIDTNVRRLASLGLATVVVADAHTTRNRPHMKAAQIIEHHNWVWSDFSSPGVSLALRDSAAVDFRADAPC
ncbi:MULTISPECIES: isochorismatase family protein [unclassified Janthinobacterium]|uniref:isochorismatase family protein n=1 Tax=unclassified Janthinobacterium TaxID=2610881 RepID=UPI0003494382|nr:MULTISPECIES: isochorismatase family protein [unclassified Janthinobacterium]MEC5160472.1 nicotinamidase-related amidase [Janthinobacterium sp. CG_S6]